MKGVKTRHPRSTPPWCRDGDQRGQAVVELALLLPVLLLLCMGTVDFGRGLNSWVAMQNAAREGAFFSVKTCTTVAVGSPPSCISSTSLRSVVLAEAGSALPDTSAVVVSGPHVVAGSGDEPLYQVSVSYTFYPNTPVISAVGIPMTVTVAVPTTS